jgi:hypothetical protein
MDALNELRVERTLLEFRLLMLERAIQDQHQQRGAAAPELVRRESELFAQLAPVNAQLPVQRTDPE